MILEEHWENIYLPRRLTNPTSPRVVTAAAYQFLPVTHRTPSKRSIKKFVTKFSSYPRVIRPTDTDRQANVGQNITSLAEIMIGDTAAAWRREVILQTAQVCAQLTQYSLPPRFPSDALAAPPANKSYSSLGSCRFPNMPSR